MKRLILAVILLFPVITLVLWFCWGSSQRIKSELPTATNLTDGTNLINVTNTAPPAKP